MDTRRTCASQVVECDFVFKEKSTGFRGSMTPSITTHAKWDILESTGKEVAMGGVTRCSVD